MPDSRLSRFSSLTTVPCARDAALVKLRACRNANREMARQIMVIVWAFAGDNESRKNYFRAILAFFVLFIGLIVLLAVFGNGAAILKQLESVARKG